MLLNYKKAAQIQQNKILFYSAPTERFLYCYLSLEYLLVSKINRKYTHKNKISNLVNFYADFLGKSNLCKHLINS